MVLGSRFASRPGWGRPLPLRCVAGLAVTIPPRAVPLGGAPAATVVVTVEVAADEVAELAERFGSLRVAPSVARATCGANTRSGGACRRVVARAGLRCYQHQPATPVVRARSVSPVSVSSGSSPLSVRSDSSLQGLPEEEAARWRAIGRRS